MISAAALRAMMAAGATTEMIVAAVEADQIADAEKLDAKRKKARERKAAWRELSRSVQGTTRDSGDNAGHSGTKERSPTPPKENNPLVSPTEKHSPRAIENLFSEFYEVFPRKVGKGDARKAYRKALQRGSAAEILAGAKRYRDSKPDPQFTKTPAPWLNADRWLDETAPKNGVAKGPWKPLPPAEPDPIRPPADEREAQVQRLLRARAM